MPSVALDHQLGQAVLDSVQNASYPESEEVIAAELPPSAIPNTLKLLERARNEVKASIQGISRDSAPDIDGWITQAKQLRHDIDLAHETSSRIVDGATEAERLLGCAEDAASKVALLEGEVAFTETLVLAFQRIQGLGQVLDTVQRDILEDPIIDTPDMLVEAATQLEIIRHRCNTRAAGILKSKLARLQAEVEESLLHHWRMLVHVEVSPPIFKIQHEIQAKSFINLDTVVHAMRKCGILETAIATLCAGLNDSILHARLQRHRSCITFDEDELRVTEITEESSTQKLFDDLSKVIVFLEKRLPLPVLHRVSQILTPCLTSRIQSDWLSSTVLAGLEALESLQITIQSVILFGEFLEEHQWPGKADLIGWTESTPRLWLNKRRESSLSQIRSLLALGPQGAEVVERVETQFLSPKEGAFANVKSEDDWNAEWSDEEASTKPPPVSSGVGLSERSEVKDDAAAWGLDAHTNGGEAQSQEPEALANEDDDAWGWGEDEDIGESPKSTKKVHPDLPRQPMMKYPEPPAYTEKEVTLKETYSITDLPREVLEIISNAVMDAESLLKARSSESRIACAATGLLELPSFILSMYRASAPGSYSSSPSGNMLLYNDSSWLAEALQELARKNTATPLDFSTDMKALTSFSRRAYGKEMESQRTILSDLLDGAQGFAQCTEPPFAQECELAINSAIDRLRDLYGQWQPVLSHSALLQSLGSLLSTLINKIIVDVEDMSDISEAESQRLTSFCSRVAGLEDLFKPQSPAPGQDSKKETVPLTAVYTPGWLKFQYLANILESSLVDIKFLWEEGELSLEFEMDELVELIEALFADSEHRRRAIGEMRRRSGNR